MRTTLIAVLAATLAIVACTQVEGTGRNQLLLFSDAEMSQLGAKAYQDVKAKNRRSGDPVATALIQRVGQRLAQVAPPRGFSYEFLLIDSDEPNAFCLPGGKVAFYTGILGLCRNEAGVAAVMGHEIAHAIANHGNERMSQNVLFQGSTVLLSEILAARQVDPTTQNLAVAAFGLGGQFGVLLPYSRSHESEADYLGMLYMAKAGYDPAEAEAFWKRFAAIGGGGWEFMSTHPSSERRAADLRAALPEAKRLYAAVPTKHGAGAAIDVRYTAPKP